MIDGAVLRRFPMKEVAWKAISPTTGFASSRLIEPKFQDFSIVDFSSSGILPRRPKWVKVN